jgi:hypothetical protein
MANGAPYFEGWYLKFETKTKRALAVIPAFHTDGTGRAEASIQVITDSGSWNCRYAADDYFAISDRFWVAVGQSVFSERGGKLDIVCEGLSLRGTLRFGKFCTLHSDIMGPFRFLAGMECAHGVISMGHRLSGTLTLNGEVIDFTDGMGYIECDRGRSFPREYLWAQSMSHTRPRSSLMVAVASVPLPVGELTGCIAAVVHDGREYRLATYRGAAVEYWSPTGAMLRQGRYRLAVAYKGGREQPLRAPVGGSMSRTIHESVCAGLRVRFWVGERLLIDRSDSAAGFESVREL